MRQISAAEPEEFDIAERPIYRMAIVTEDLIYKERKALFKAGGYRSEQAIVGHVVEVFAGRESGFASARGHERAA